MIAFLTNACSLYGRLAVFLLSEGFARSLFGFIVCVSSHEAQRNIQGGEGLGQKPIVTNATILA